MKSVIERLDDIENTARSIVAKAEEDKSQVEQEIQEQREISLIKNWMRRHRQNLPEFGKMESGRSMNS